MENNNIVHDWISNKDILKVHNELYLIKDGKKMRINAFIIKERKENN